MMVMLMQGSCRLFH